MGSTLDLLTTSIRSVGIRRGVGFWLAVMAARILSPDAAAVFLDLGYRATQSASEGGGTACVTYTIGKSSAPRPAGD